jgi:hypothetical protein
MSIEVIRDKPDRLHIDLDDETVVRHWISKTGKSKQEIAAAIEKVGNNIESVERELGCK